MTIDGIHISADEGKILKRISDGSIFGKEIFLGLIYTLNRQTLETPLLELPEHYTEIDEPKEEEPTKDPLTDPPLISEDVNIKDTVDDLNGSTLENPKRVVTLSDYEALEQKVLQLQNIINQFLIQNQL